MKKNVVWWTGIVNPELKDKYGEYGYFQYSRKTWEYWCKKNDCLFVPFTEPVEKDLFKFRPNWQKAIFCFDELERLGIEYNQIALIDSSHMIKWDAPNFFEMTEGKMCAMRDIDNMRWIYDSIQGYKEFFDNFEFDQSKYVNSAPMIFNENHKELFTSFKKFYYDNVDELVRLQDEVVKKGTEQTPLNYWLQINNVDVKLDLPLPFKLTHMHRKELFGHNWQLNEDNTPFFIKYGYNWVFNGIPKDERTNLMSQVWNGVKHNYTLDEDEVLLNSVRHKETFKKSTSRKFIKDLINFFKSRKFKSIVELGCCHGDSTKVFSKLFERVHAVDWAQENIDRAKDMCEGCDNITYQVSNVSDDEWDYPEADVVFIDASHDHPQVEYDIERAIKYFNNPIIVMDDYGNPHNKAIRLSIDNKVKEGKLKIHSLIGESEGTQTSAGWAFYDREGVICNVE